MSEERHSVPTTYNGTRFRSRLEARWAAFFGRLGWPWEYEPFDAAGYIPDFVLLGADPVLVDVKPVVGMTQLHDRAPFVVKACREVWHRDILVVGASAFFPSATWGDPALGHLSEHAAPDDFLEEETWMAGEAIWHTCGAPDCGSPSFHHDVHAYRSRLCGHGDGDSYLSPPSVDVLRGAWAEAGNAVQWRAR